MDKRQDLAEQIKKLDKKEMEILRLKYGGGHNYNEIAEALKIPVNEVGFKLFSALKQLGADGAASLSDAERAKILGFIHGELEQSDLQTMATRIESEPGLRAEFESWLAISDELEKLLAKPSKKPETPAAAADADAPAGRARPGKKFWIAVAGVLAVSVALPLLKNLGGGEAGEMAAVQMPADIPPAPEGQTVPPVDNLAPQGEQPAETAATDTPPPAAEPSHAASETPPAAEPEKPTQAQPASIPPTGTTKVSKAFEGNPGKKMGVFASKVKVSKNLNTKKVLLALQQRLDGKPSCVPPKLAHLKAVNVKIKLAADGGIASVDGEPKNKLFSKCLKRLLDDKPVAFKASKKGATSIALSLKNF